MRRKERPGRGAIRIGEAEPPPQELRILIVEDEGIAALDLEETVRFLGHRVVAVVGSGAAAVKAAQIHAPDLVLMDVRLADGPGDADGVDTAMVLRWRLATLSVFLTAHADPHTRARARSAEPLGYLEKPVTRDQLRIALRSAAEQLRPAR